MQDYAASLTQYKRLKTRAVNVGGLLIGDFNPIRLQTMTTTDTMDTEGTVAQTIRCIEAGAELVRITAPSKKEAENLLLIKNELNRRGYHVPLVADIHFTPNAAEIAARIIEKVRVNPGNYVDKKKFEQIDYTDAEYLEEIERIRERFTPLVKICKEYGTAMRIGTNHGSLSDRIMSRYGDTHIGMVESAMEFLRIARDQNYHNIVLSMKASNPQVMVQAYRLLTSTMYNEFGECYPLHLGVTEAGDGEDGRVKSAVGMGTLLEDGIGDTVRVSLTEEPELEIPVCRDLVKRYTHACDREEEVPFTGSPIVLRSTPTFTVDNMGTGHVPVVIADLSKLPEITPVSLERIGYTYDAATDKWSISDTAADYVFTGKEPLGFALPGMLKVITWPAYWMLATDKTKYFPLFSDTEYLETTEKSDTINFVMVDCFNEADRDKDLAYLETLGRDKTAVLCLNSTNTNAMQSVRRMYSVLAEKQVGNPTILMTGSSWATADEHLIHYATEAGALLLDGHGNGVCFGMKQEAYDAFAASFSQETLNGRNYNTNTSIEQFVNATAFSILQATRTRISKTEYISCPSCGRTLFDLQETTAKIRSRTHHLKGVKIAIMGCIVNGPGEMADADFGYVGSGVGKITLYKGKDVVKKGVDSEIAVDELIALLKENGAWVEPSTQPQTA
ncbi:(E)-4-hydroxy-3-methylbut-2-enyl-diphosphate synthase [Taibaiella chishuiensis]|uniref:4-hydroxy-3-methylbut-2-en-1-yl diphosphate synthase (flavodoxin) n=1 Tax=Taibaiella chishuiensis TaxID=1434707 RepID=A0A2P8DBH2_9BACT|nr:(E)-4-hydroxy-3-methylbut-2-enyl-diphosphate synthase [Taibaiella chishuiensis]PSK94578.1 4-hydroxy-3-methylbut-2-en-1-yl diphosphate synthase [Taibaiella chishuiensis]